jgi:hypothetical protein
MPKHSLIAKAAMYWNRRQSIDLFRCDPLNDRILVGRNWPDEVETSSFGDQFAKSIGTAPRLAEDFEPGVEIPKVEEMLTAVMAKASGESMSELG